MVTLYREANKGLYAVAWVLLSKTCKPLFAPLYSTLTILERRKLLVVDPVCPCVGLDDVVRHSVDVVAETAEARAAGREVAGAVARDGDEPRLVHRHPRLDLVAELPETYPVVSQRQF